MANKKDRVKDNMPGKYYVDSNCIACSACVIEAPDHFKMNDDEGHAFVYNQPSSDKALEACENALAACPVEAIGNDG